MRDDGMEIPHLEEIDFVNWEELWAWQCFSMIYIDVKNGTGLMRAVMDYCDFYGIKGVEEKEMLYSLVQAGTPLDKADGN